MKTDYTPEEMRNLRERDWSLNVRDEFKGMTVEEVKDALQLRRSTLQLAFVNALRDFNFAALLRASNAFCCESVVYAGHRRYDPRGAVGVKNYENIYHLEDEDLLQLYINIKRDEGYTFVVAESDIYPNSKALPEYQWNPKTVLMFGEESIGVPEEFISLADDVVYVKQLGSVRSMNVSATAHIFLFDYAVKTGRM